MFARHVQVQRAMCAAVQHIQRRIIFTLLCICGMWKETTAMCGGGGGGVDTQISTWFRKIWLALVSIDRHRPI